MSTGRGSTLPPPPGQKRCREPITFLPGPLAGTKRHIGRSRNGSCTFDKLPGFLAKKPAGLSLALLLDMEPYHVGDRLRDDLVPLLGLLDLLDDAARDLVRFPDLTLDRFITVDVRDLDEVGLDRLVDNLDLLLALRELLDLLPAAKDARLVGRGVVGDLHR